MEQLPVHRTDALGINKGRLTQPLGQLDYTQVIRNGLAACYILQQTASSADKSVTFRDSAPDFAQLHPVDGFHPIRGGRPFRIYG
ncbi:hypothetical protein D3C74_440150 [compost metagenome]